MQHGEEELLVFKRQPIHLREREYLVRFAYSKYMHLVTQGAKQTWCAKELVSNYFSELEVELAQSEFSVLDLCPSCQGRYAYQHPELEKDPEQRFMRWLEYEREKWHSLVEFAQMELDKAGTSEAQLWSTLTQELTNQAIERATLLDLETLYHQLIVSARQWQLNRVLAELSKAIIQYARLQEEEAKALSTLATLQDRFKLTVASAPKRLTTILDCPVFSLSEIRSHMPLLSNKNSRPNGYTYSQAVEQLIAKEAEQHLGVWPINIGERVYYKKARRNEPFSAEAYFKGINFLKQWLRAMETGINQLKPQLEGLKTQIEELKQQYLRLDTMGREHAKGSHNGRAKLSEEIVRIIRQDTTTPGAELARRYGVDHHVISRIRKGLSWKHVV